MQIPIGVEHAPITSLKPNPRNARTHSPKQIRPIASSIEQFGFTNPVLIDERMTILAGHGRVEGAKLLNMKEEPIVRIEHLSEAQKRAYVIADNQLALKAGWDDNILAIEFQALDELNFDLELTGFDMGEIDQIIGSLDLSKKGEDESAVPEPSSGPSVTQLGDVWQIGGHRLICADATLAETYQQLLGDEKAQLIFTDPPYNVPIAGHVSGLGGVKHREFAMATGEMSRRSSKFF